MARGLGLTPATRLCGVWALQQAGRTQCAPRGALTGAGGALAQAASLLPACLPAAGAPRAQSMQMAGLLTPAKHPEPCPGRRAWKGAQGRGGQRGAHLPAPPAPCLQTPAWALLPRAAVRVGQGSWLPHCCGLRKPRDQVQGLLGVRPPGVHGERPLPARGPWAQEAMPLVQAHGRCLARSSLGWWAP